jgi:hypothetical protein
LLIRPKVKNTDSEEEEISNCRRVRDGIHEYGKTPASWRKRAETMTIRKITSLTAGINLVLLVLTSVILYISPMGRVAYWANWKFWGLTKVQWGDLHLNLGLLFLLAALLHSYYNWPAIISYLKNRARTLTIFTGDSSVALALTLLVGLGTFFMGPPMSTVINFGATLKDAAAERYGEPPYGHAELSSLELFVKKVGLDLERTKKILLQRGVRFENEQQSILAIAENNNLSPKELYDIMKEAAAQAGGSFPASPEPGFGRKKLADICKAYNLQTADVLSAMEKQGITADPDRSLKENADANNVDSRELFEIMKSVANGA